MTFHQHQQTVPHPHPTFSTFYSPTHMENQFNYQISHHHNHQQFPNNPYQQQQQHIHEISQPLPIRNSPIHPRMGVPNIMHNSNWSEQISIQTRNNNYGNGNKSNEYG